MKVRELRKIAGKLGIKNYGRMRKEELVRIVTPMLARISSATRIQRWWKMASRKRNSLCPITLEGFNGDPREPRAFPVVEPNGKTFYFDVEVFGSYVEATAMFMNPSTRRELNIVEVRRLAHRMSKTIPNLFDMWVGRQAIRKKQIEFENDMETFEVMLEEITADLMLKSIQISSECAIRTGNSAPDEGWTTNNNLPAAMIISSHILMQYVPQLIWTLQKIKELHSNFDRDFPATFTIIQRKIRSQLKGDPGHPTVDLVGEDIMHIVDRYLDLFFLSFAEEQ